MYFSFVLILDLNVLSFCHLYQKVVAFCSQNVFMHARHYSFYSLDCPFLPADFDLEYTIPLEMPCILKELCIKYNGELFNCGLFCGEEMPTRFFIGLL